MAIIAGKETKLYCSGEAVALVDEATTSGDNLVYQVTDSNKRVFARDAVITVDDREPRTKSLQEQKNCCSR